MNKYLRLASPPDPAHLPGRFANDILRYIPAFVLPALFGLLGVAVFTRVFPPSEYGLYSLILAISGPLMTLLTEWVAQPVGRFYAEYKRRKREDDFRQAVGLLTSVTVVLILLLGLLLGIGFVLIAGAIPRPLVFFGAVAVVLAQSMMSIILPILPASLNPAAYRYTMLVTAGLSVGLALGLIYFLGANIAWLLWGQALAVAAVLPYLFWKTKVSLQNPFSKLTPRAIHIVKRFWNYGLPMMIWFFAAGILSMEDRYIIQLFHGVEEVGIYGVNYNLIMALVVLLNTPVHLASGPILYQQWAQRLVKDVEITISRMTELYIILALALVGGVAALGEILVTFLLGEEFHEGANILLPVSIGIVFWGAANIGRKGLELHERTKQLAYYALVAAFINLLLNLLFVPIYGYIAAAYTTLVSYAAYTVIIWWKSAVHIPWKIDMKRLGYYFMYMLLSTLLTSLFLSSIEEAHALVRICLGGLIFLTSYGILLLLLSRNHVLTLITSMGTSRAGK